MVMQKKNNWLYMKNLLKYIRKLPVSSIGFVLIVNFIFCGFISTSASAEIVDRIVAIVNNDIVTLNQLNKGAAIYIKNIETASYSDNQKQENIRKINEQVLTSLIDKSLTHQEAKKYNIKISKNEIDKSIENIMKSKSFNIEEFKNALALEGLDFQEYRKNLEKQILQTKLINYAVKSKIVILESNILSYYEKHKKQYAGIQKYHLRNILMNSEKKIRQVRKKLENGGNFKTVAKEHSIAQNAHDSGGGDLGVFDITNLPETIQTQISLLKQDQFTEVISTTQGFQIFYIQDIIFSNGQTYDEVHDEIYTILYKEQADKKFQTWLESLKQKAHIKIML